jgi:hypothetical protein
MQRFKRSSLLCIWCCLFLAAFTYVLFDLLDIDGSNFDRAPGTATAAEEQLGGEDVGRYVAMERDTAWLPPRPGFWSSKRLATTPIIRFPRSFLPHSRPRVALPLPGTASAQPDNDPARASAQA